MNISNYYCIYIIITPIHNIYIFIYIFTEKPRKRERNLNCYIFENDKLNECLIIIYWYVLYFIIFLVH